MAGISFVILFLDHDIGPARFKIHARWYIRSENVGRVDLCCIFPLERLVSTEAFANYQATYSQLYSGRVP